MGPGNLPFTVTMGLVEQSLVVFLSTTFTRYPEIKINMLDYKTWKQHWKVLNCLNEFVKILLLMHSGLVTTRGCNIYVFFFSFFFPSFLGGRIVQLMIDFRFQNKWNMIGLWFWYFISSQISFIRRKNDLNRWNCLRSIN